MKIYTVTTIPHDYPYKGCRCIGWFPERSLAVTAIKNNFGDMNEEGHYLYALVEEVKDGIYTFPREENWFEWKQEIGVGRPTSRYMPLDKKPNRFSQVVCFSMG